MASKKTNITVSREFYDFLKKFINERKHLEYQSVAEFMREATRYYIRMIEEKEIREKEIYK